MSLIALSYWDLSLAALLVFINAALSMYLRLGLGRQIAVASLRMVVQLALMGLVLKVLLATVSFWLTLAAALVMVGFAGWEVLQRQGRRVAGIWGYGIGTGSVFFAGISITILALAVPLQPEPWYHPRYAIPLLGMILGNAMTGISLALDRMTDGIASGRAGIEAQLALGAGKFVALRPVMRMAFRAGLVPSINAMAAAGLVYLPGMMTGQILAGTDPVEAIKYQILVLFLITGASGIGVLAGLFACATRLTDARHRLRLDRLADRA